MLLLAQFCEATSRFKKLLSQKGKLWIASPLLAALQAEAFKAALRSSGTIQHLAPKLYSFAKLEMALQSGASDGVGQ